MAFAVATETRTETKEVDTGYGPDRQANMVAFAVHALKLVKETISGQANL